MLAVIVRTPAFATKERLLRPAVILVGPVGVSTPSGCSGMPNMMQLGYYTPLLADVVANCVLDASISVPNILREQIRLHQYDLLESLDAFSLPSPDHVLQDDDPNAEAQK